MGSIEVNKKRMSAVIIADSISPGGVRITTAEVKLWKPLVAEFNTHKVLSRNSASTRAIPAKRQISTVLEDPYIPAFKYNQSGMQPAELLTERDMEKAVEEWLIARDNAVQTVLNMGYCENSGISPGVHKQWCGRLLEPWLLTTILVTATDYQNFFNLRCNPLAQDEIRWAAENLKEAMDNSKPVERLIHTPYVNIPEEDFCEATCPEDLAMYMKISAGRCATVSYDNLGEGINAEKDLARCESLISCGHWSPLEHVAFIDESACDYRTYSGNFRHWQQFRKTYKGEAVYGNDDAQYDLQLR